MCFDYTQGLLAFDICTKLFGYDICIDLVALETKGLPPTLL
jgi:hypothetical protein